MYKELKLVRVNEKYIKFLSAIDNKVPYNSKNKKGRPLLENQIRWCLDNNKKIKKHAIKLRKRRLINKLPNKIINRCCDFCLLEKQLEKYL